jgi:hypothetical protein
MEISTNRNGSRTLGITLAHYRELYALLGVVLAWIGIYELLLIAPANLPHREARSVRSLIFRAGGFGFCCDFRDHSSDSRLVPTSYRSCAEAEGRQD